MAIILISPKKRQKTLFGVIILFLILIFIIVFLVIFIQEFKNKIVSIPIEEGVFSSSNIKINFSIVDSDKVKNLETFTKIQEEFTYFAKDKDENQVTGRISAFTKEDALIALEGLGFKEIVLEKSSIGRIEPFIPYYQQTINLKK